MRIGIDVRKYFDYGIGTYIQNLLREFDQTASHDIVLFALRRDAAAIKRKHDARIVINNSSRYSLLELLSLSWQSNRDNHDLFHSPHYTLPVGLKGRRVVTIHDLIHVTFQEHYNTLHRAYAQWMIKHACKASDAIILDSAFVAAELLRFTPVSNSKVHVVPLGVESLFFGERSQEEIDTFMSKHAMKSPLVLYVGSLKPHKNVTRLFEAISRLASELNVQLGLVGESLTSYPHLKAIADRLGVAGRIVHLGRLNKRELVLAYKAADVTVLPSLYEGFGLTALEAMASGTPVVASNTASLPEVVGDAGLLVDPLDSTALAVAMQKVISDKTVRTDLVRKGTLNARRFTWEECARRTLKVYEQLLGKE